MTTERPSVEEAAQNNPKMTKDRAEHFAKLAKKLEKKPEWKPTYRLQHPLASRTVSVPE